MKVKILGNINTVKDFKERLQNNEIEFVDENEEFIIIPTQTEKKPIIGKIGDEMFILKPSEIIYFKSDGNDTECITENNTYYIRDKLYQIEAHLTDAKFLRISRFHVVNTKRIKSIKSSQNMKFDLTMSNNHKISVTRSYYYIFKEYFGI